MNLNQQITYMRGEVARLKKRVSRIDLTPSEMTLATANYCAALAVLETLTQLRGIGAGSAGHGA